MAIKPVQTADIEEQQRALNQKVNAAASVMPENAQAAIAMVRDQYIVFRGVRYAVPPIPFDVGLDLQDKFLRMHEIGEKYPDARGMLPTYKKLLTDVAKAVWQHLVPLEPKVFLKKRLRIMKNPFLTAQEGDLQSVLGFFLLRRMMSSVRFSSEKK